MQIIIPMSGFGERFRRAGYTVPKPLIMVDGKPIIAHVLDLFPGEQDVLFICNQDHLDDPAYRMAEILRQHCPTGKIVGIAPHKFGPTHAVLQAAGSINQNKPAIVSYCDYTGVWDYAAFKHFVSTTGCDAAGISYTGFHPHMLRNTNYGYVQLATDGRVTAIQEKQSYTAQPMAEHALAGAYYFRTGQHMLAAMTDQLRHPEWQISGEQYVSLAFRPLLEQGAHIRVFDMEYFMQWGTPDDLRDYQRWSEAFRWLGTKPPRQAHHDGLLLMPMAGLGKRFADAGYALVKPLIPVDGKPMVVQATDDLPSAPRQRFVVRKDLPGLTDIQAAIRQAYPQAEFVTLDQLTDGQARTCLLGLQQNVAIDAPVTIGACDNGMLYDSDKFAALMTDRTVDVLVWTVRGHAHAIAKPQMYGWVDAAEDGTVKAVSVKQPLANPQLDPIITGAFTFKRAGDFIKAVESLIARNGKINGEYYIDSCLTDALALGLRCKLFEIDHYLGWGTPDDLKTYEYWQQCFNRLPWHPYKMKTIP